MERGLHARSDYGHGPSPLERESNKSPGSIADRIRAQDFRRIGAEWVKKVSHAERDPMRSRLNLAERDPD